MVSRTATATSPLERLFLDPHHFGFHQAVRLIERWLCTLESEERPVLRFRNPLSLAFPASEIAALDGVTVTGEGRDVSATGSAAPAAVQRVEITPSFMGLLGTCGALPLAYSEQLAASEWRHRDHAARAFLDIFQHRAITLFHEAWRKHRLPMQFEADRHEGYLPLVLSLAGIGQKALRNRLHAGRGGVSDDVLACYAGLLQRRCISACHLQRVLTDYFNVPVRIEQFTGRWFALDPESQSALGVASATLGCDALVGERVWQRDLRVRIVLGPLGTAQQERFLPGGAGALALKELLTLATGLSLEYEVRLRLHADAVSASRLAGTSEGPRSHLGWNTFLLSRPSAVAREESAYELHAATG